MDWPQMTQMPRMDWPQMARITGAFAAFARDRLFCSG
jgi:hypothetical protein